MNKNVLALDRAAMDAEIERLAELVSLGGYIPAPITGCHPVQSGKTCSTTAAECVNVSTADLLAPNIVS